MTFTDTIEKVKISFEYAYGKKINIAILDILCSLIGGFKTLKLEEADRDGDRDWKQYLVTTGDMWDIYLVTENDKITCINLLSKNDIATIVCGYQGDEFYSDIPEKKTVKLRRK